MSNHSFPHDPDYAQCINANQTNYNRVAQELEIETIAKDWNTLGQRLEQQAKNVSTQAATKAQASQDPLLQWVQSFRKKHTQTIQQLQTTLGTQQRSRDRFTMVFMGRTKAGKSTLLAILLNEGDEGIGKGQQRTTRENRIYDLPNHVRLIDTPGIAAVGGEADTAEALRAVDQADVICYVVSNDSIQVGELDIFKQLKDQSKPLVILLNVQKDLTNPTRRRRFLDKPEQLMANDDIEGHKKRIYSYLEQYYDSSITVFPVMLLAARLSQREPDPGVKEKLYTASQISAFLDYGDNCIRHHLPLISSKNIIGGTCDKLTQLNKTINDDRKECDHIIQVLTQPLNAIETQVSSLHQDIKTEINAGVDQIYSTVIQEIPAFVRTAWSKSTKDQQVEWEQLKKNKKLEWQTTELIERLNWRYRERTREFIEEIGFQYKTTARDSNFSGESADFDLSWLLQAASVALGVGSLFIPGGILVRAGFMGVSAVSGITSTMNREARRQKAITQLEDLLRREMLMEREELKRHLRSFFETQVSSIKQTMEKHKTLVKRVPKQLMDFRELIRSHINKMTGWFALDIFIYCHPNHASVRSRNLGEIIARVQRKPNHFFKIFTRLRVTPQQEREVQCGKIIGERIIFVHLSK